MITDNLKLNSILFIKTAKKRNFKRPSNIEHTVFQKNADILKNRYHMVVTKYNEIRYPLLSKTSPLL